MLYIVGTPIGNAHDMSMRAAKVLADADIVYCEDTRSYSKLWAKSSQLFSLQAKRTQKVFDFHTRNEFERVPEIIGRLEDGLSIALISEAGMPGVSDPGQFLIKKLTERGIPFTAIPGPTAAMTAVVLSGFQYTQILFLGFLPKSPMSIKKTFESILSLNENTKHLVAVMYESPLRLPKTLNILSDIAPNAQVAVCREMTKSYEQVIHGQPHELSNEKYKGEISVVLKLS